MTQPSHIGEGLLVLLAAGALSAASGCIRRPPAVYPVHFARGPVKIDGEIDEPDWQRARSLALGEAGVYGRARVMWDSRYLYAAVECPLADRITGDSLILGATGARRVHFKFEPDGNCWDLRSASPRSAVGLSGLLTYATYAHGKTKWTVEVRIPLTAFGAVGSPVTLHLARIGGYRPAAADADAEPVQSEHTRRLEFTYPAAEPRPAGAR